VRDSGPVTARKPSPVTRGQSRRLRLVSDFSFATARKPSSVRLHECDRSTSVSAGIRAHSVTTDGTGWGGSSAVAEGAEPPAPPPQPTRRELGKAPLQLGDLLDGEVSSPHGSFHGRRKLARDDAAVVLQPPPGSLQGECRAGERAHTCQPSCPHPAGAPPAPLSVGAAALAH
jgi:hypothetical protein